MWNNCRFKRWRSFNIIKQKYGGSIKFRSVKQLDNKEGMIGLVNGINGKIRNSKRIPNLRNVF